MNKEFELIKLHNDNQKIEFGVYNKDKSLKGYLILEAPYNECRDSDTIILK